MNKLESKEWMMVGVVGPQNTPRPIPPLDVPEYRLRLSGQVICWKYINITLGKQKKEKIRHPNKNKFVEVLKIGYKIQIRQDKEIKIRAVRINGHQLKYFQSKYRILDVESSCHVEHRVI